MAAEITRLTGVPARWALAGAELTDPAGGVEIILRTANTETFTSHRIRSQGATHLNTKLVTSRKCDVEVRVRSIRPDVEASEVFLLLEQRIWRGTSTPRFNAVDLAFLSMTAGVEIPNVAEYEGIAGAAVSECLGTIHLAMRDQDVVTDTFDGWIESCDVTRTEPNGPKTEHIG